MRKIVVPPGTGDGLWVAMKLNPLKKYDVIICRGGSRSVDFWHLLPFVNSVVVDEKLTYPIHCTHAMNSHLESGHRIDSFGTTNWKLQFNITEDHQKKANEKLQSVSQDEILIGIYASTKNHAWINEAWRPEEYRKLAEFFQSTLGKNYRCRFIEIGSQHDNLLEGCDFGQIVSKDLSWGATIALIQQLDGMVGFASGVPIMAEYLGIPTIMLMPKHLEKMQNSFCHPENINTARWKCSHFENANHWIEWIHQNNWPFGRYYL